MQNLSFADLQLHSKREIEIEIPVKSHLKAIRVDVKASVKLLSTETQSLQQSHSIHCNLYDNQSQFSNFYLQQTKEKDYVLHVLG